GPRQLRRIGLGTSVGTTSGEGLSPVIPQQEAGMRMEPPMSSPKAMVQSPAATAAPLPPLEPPGVQPAFQGFWVGGKSSLTVPTEPPSSGVCVLPMTAAPAALAFATTMAPASAIL